MDKLLHLIMNFANGSILYLILFIVGSFVLYHLAKLKSQRVLALSVLKVVQSVVNAKFGDRADALVQIIIDGLQKIQDGNFDNDDCIDWFLRYIKLGASQKGIQLSESDIETLHTIVSTTIYHFIDKKPKEIEKVVNQFTIMNVNNHQK